MASSDHTNLRSQRYRLGGTLRGDLLLYVDNKAIEIGSDWSPADDGVVEITLFAPSVNRWQYPHHDKPVTDSARVEILQEASRLLARDESLRVKIHW